MSESVTTEAQGPIEELKWWARNLLKAHPYFVMPVLVEDQKDLLNEIERALGLLQGDTGKIGLYVTVILGAAQGVSANLPTPVYEDVELIVRVIENPTFNLTSNGYGLRASAVALKANEVLHHKSENSLCNPIIAQAVRPTTVRGFEDYAVYDAMLKTGLRK